MWQELHCSYFIELIIRLVSDAVSALCSEPVNREEFEARVSNLEFAIETLQSLLLTYREENLIPGEYISLYSPLVDLKKAANSLALTDKLGRKTIVYADLIKYKEEITTIYQRITQNLTAS